MRGSAPRSRASELRPGSPGEEAQVPYNARRALLALIVGANGTARVPIGCLPAASCGRQADTLAQGSCPSRVQDAVEKKPIQRTCVTSQLTFTEWQARWDGHAA